MGGSYTADEQAAAALAGAIADDKDDLKAGRVTKTTSSTTALVTHGLTGTPDFIVFSWTKGGTVTQTVNTTTITFTRGTAATSWSVSYIAGYTA